MPLEVVAPENNTKAIYKMDQFVTNKGDTIQEFTLVAGEEAEGKEHPRFVIHTHIRVQTPDGQVQPFPFPIPITADYKDLDEVLKDLDQIIHLGKEEQIKQIKDQETRMSLSRGLSNMGVPTKPLISPD